MLFRFQGLYDRNDLPGIISSMKDDIRLSRKKDGHRYYELSCAFDIETSSWIENGQKRACMYIWQFGIQGYVFTGRTWEQFTRFLKEVCSALEVSPEQRLIVGVHNLAYEFQFMRKWLQWDKVFAVKSRTPVYALTDFGIEFRCTYILSGYSLANLSKNLHAYPVQKKSGDLDYSKIRNKKTVLTKKELDYCIYDVYVVMAYLQECIETEGSISRIPLTKTGYVRRFCRKQCLYPREEGRTKSIQGLRYREKMKRLTLEADEYEELKRAFAGGFTHASALYSGADVYDVGSYDFTSSYPYVIVSEQFPMSKGKRVYPESEKDFMKYLQNYACMFDIEIWGVRDTFIYDHYISAYKCYRKQGYRTDNGRIVSADYICMTVTEQDYAIIRKTYAWDRMQVSNMFVYHKAYLPTAFIKAVLQLYSDKTTLKGVEGMEVEYLQKKEMLNSCYGMMVTDIVRPENEYSGKEWKPARMPDLIPSINEYNSGFGRFLFYPWGVWVTAYARRNLWTGILEFSEDHVYSDTDSEKAVNIHAHDQYIKMYNDQARHKLEKACRHHGIPFEMVEPVTVKGERKLLGVWDFDGSYSRFKTLGAKRYMVQDANTGQVNITVSGLNKKVTVPYLCEGWRADLSSHEEYDTPFDRFNAGLDVPAEYTGKNTHTYIDTCMHGHVTDYQGHDAVYNEKSGVHMEGAAYSLSIAEEYKAYLLELEDIDNG